jgi:hypothetical protein
MSALPPKADIVQHSANVRVVPKADIGPLFWHRQFRLIAAQRPISAIDRVNTFGRQGLAGVSCLNEIALPLRLGLR